MSPASLLRKQRAVPKTRDLNATADLYRHPYQLRSLIESKNLVEFGHLRLVDTFSLTELEGPPSSLRKADVSLAS
jgi:hypothetical protein